MPDSPQKTLRAFVAIELKDNVREFLETFLAHVEPRSRGCRLVSPNSLHITLLFLGNDVKESLSADIGEVLRSVSSHFPSFQLSLGNLGAFPSKSRPRVIFSDVDGEKDVLLRLAQSVRTHLSRLGFEDDGDFTPHITLARVKDAPSFSGFMEWKQSYDKLFREKEHDLVWSVTEVLLMESRLTPKGPIYTGLERALLKGER